MSSILVLDSMRVRPLPHAMNFPLTVDCILWIKVVRVLISFLKEDNSGDGLPPNPKADKTG